ncbi:hypothetical protein AGMMS49573_05060 [Endomicrobiia bacterium]|nr:hypothetical protein AGMMS49573_05060 [Endomicrobiia bacterium]
MLSLFRADKVRKDYSEHGLNTIKKEIDNFNAEQSKEMFKNFKIGKNWRIKNAFNGEEA